MNKFGGITAIALVAGFALSSSAVAVMVNRNITSVAVQNIFNDTEYGNFTTDIRGPVNTIVNTAGSSTFNIHDVVLVPGHSPLVGRDIVKVPMKP